MQRTPIARRLAAALVAVGLAAAGCSSSSGGGGGGAFELWDPYPHFDASSEWAKVIDRCGQQNGVKVERQSYDTTDLTSKVLLAAQQGTAPEVLVVDNPVVSTLAEAGVLKSNQDSGLDASAAAPNLVAAAQTGGKTYGVPIGANTLGLYYNKPVLNAAGVDPATITDWASLDAALAKVAAAGRKGITFAAIGTEEGTFQFLPWFWGAGANLTKLDSPEAESALALWKSWLDKGYATDTAIGNTQVVSWQEFATGEYAFAENGTWNLANAAKTGFEVGVLAIPARSGGVAPAPTGGEFVTVPAQRDSATEATAAKVAACLVSPDNVLATDTALTYVSAVPSVRDKQVAQQPELKVWAEAVQAAKGRTGDGLGTKYPRISQPLWTAVQAALTGAKSPREALAEAASAAAK
ncbi:sugar ABC transporter substrate-binding protein [Saccharothrix variisporea]|uniref:Carbohydrate ABC transporter substrate-binding protein (CUT1 family) n=1 Tax=Saccharothrix variisporea TaxID=543527 RepID=A0A495X1X5_9PSEU|nr:extracellular solute-binding protein [Saccharothrix variisporea]RKT67877.1 carbohydrate ABC transporter substrate-binding protein (CUT1 family) [Saccharothrix variisporea]